MRKYLCSTLLSTAVAAVAVFAQPAAAGEDFFDNPRLVTDGLPEGGIFRPVVPPATVGYPVPAADPVYRTYTSLPAEPSGLTYVVEPLGTADLAVDIPSAPAAAAGTSAPAAPAAQAEGTAVAQGSPSVISFTVPVEIPAYVAAPLPPQQYQQQYAALQRQYAEQIRQIQAEYAARLQQQREAYTEQVRQQQAQQAQQAQYAEQLRQQQLQQEEYAARVREQRQRQEQYMAQVQQYRLHQEQQAALARQQQEAYAEQMRQELQRQQMQQMPAQQPAVRQFPPDQPVPPQPAQRLPQSQQPYPIDAPAAAVPPLTASRPADFGLALPAGSAPVQAGEYASALTHPSTGGDRPVLTLITPAEVKQALNQGVRLILLDVRGELVRDVEGHIPGDVTVPYEPADTFPARVRQAIPNAGLPVVVYCRDGIWSSKAGEVMARMGYRTYLMGAYRLWLWN